MELSLQLVAAIAAAIAFVPAIFFFAQAATHFIKMITRFRNRRYDLAANLVPFLIPFVSAFFTAQGNVHRRMFLRNFAAFLGCVGFIAAVYAWLGVGIRA